MESEAFAYFTSTPWCTELLKDPGFKCILAFSATQPQPDVNPFFRQTLTAPDAVRASILLHNIPAAGSELAVTKNRILLSIGKGVSGQDGICHGGFLAAAMDEGAGQLVSASGVAGKHNPFTLLLNVTYKKPVPAPGIIMIVNEIVKVDGRKIFLESMVCDAPGSICTTAQAIFVKRKGTL